MRKILLVVLFLPFISLKAQDKANEFRLGIYNDSWGGGFTSIYDDYRTYSFQFEYINHNKYKIFSNFSFLTNRFDTDLTERKSLDELILHGSIPIIWFDEGESGNIWIKAGGLARGDLIGSQIQNITHDLFEVEETDLEYYDKNKIHPIIGYDAQYLLLNKSLKKGLGFNLQLKNSLSHYHEYMSELRLGLALSLNTLESKIILSPSYTYIENYQEKNKLLSKVFDAESGFSLGFKVMGTKLFYHFQTFPFSDYSYGGFGYRFSKSKQSTSINLQLEIEASLMANSYGYNFKYLFLPFHLLKRKSKLILNHNYHTLLSKSIRNSPIVNGHANQITIGAEFELLKSKEDRKLKPYANLSIGNRAIGIYSRIPFFNNSLSHQFALNNDIGINYKIAIKSKQVNLSLYNRFMFLSSYNSDNESRFVNPKNSPYESFQQTWGLGVRIKI